MEKFQTYLKERGSLTAMARELGISHSAILQWVRIPAERVLVVERITGISRHDLRPDLYPREAPFILPRQQAEAAE